MQGQQLFFATREDLWPGLEAIESRWHLEYQVHDLRDDKEFVVYSSLMDAAGLGISETGCSMSDDSYLVYPRDARPKVRSIPQRRGGVKYEPELAGALVQFQPGGEHVASGALARFAARSRRLTSVCSGCSRFGVDSSV